MINNFNPRYNLYFHELSEYCDSPKMMRKYYKEDGTDYNVAAAKFEQKKLKKRMRNLVRDMERYVAWIENVKK